MKLPSWLHAERNECLECNGTGNCRHCEAGETFTGSRCITCRGEIDDFEVLKRELTAYHPITVFKAKVYPFSFLPVILMIGAWFLLLTSRARPVVLVAGIAALGLQAVGAYSLVAALRGKKNLRFIALMLVFTWLLIAGIVFQRVKSVL